MPSLVCMDVSFGANFDSPKSITWVVIKTGGKRAEVNIPVEKDLGEGEDLAPEGALSG